MYNAIVLAGGTSKSLGEESAPVDEALLDINGKPMILYVISALLQSKYVDQIFVAGSVRKLKQLNWPERVHLVQGGAGIMDTIQAGMRASKATKRVLVCTTDIPFLTEEAVDDFVRQCAANDADLCYSVIAEETVRAQFPDGRRTYVKLSDGVFTGGNLLLVNPAIVDRCMEAARLAVANRKKPWRLASMLGWKILAKYMVGGLSLADAKERLSEILEIRGCVVISSYAAIGMDIDKACDLELARQYLKKENE